MELNQIWLRERIFGRSAWVASRETVWLIGFACDMRRQPDIQNKSLLNATAINLRASAFAEASNHPVRTSTILSDSYLPAFSAWKSVYTLRSSKHESYNSQQERVPLYNVDIIVSP